MTALTQRGLCRLKTRLEAGTANSIRRAEECRLATEVYKGNIEKHINAVSAINAALSLSMRAHRSGLQTESADVQQKDRVI